MEEWKDSYENQKIAKEKKSMEKSGMKKNKWKDVRGALVMVLVMVAMLSTATYAWFTLSNSPTVTNLQMTAATSEGLRICATSDGTFVNAININENNSTKELSPVSVQDSDSDSVYEAKFFKPVYTGNAVNSLEATAINATSDDALDGYVAKYTYYLKSDADSVNVGIITATPSQTGDLGIDSNNQSNLVGSFVRKKDSSDDNSAMNAVRIGFVVNNTMYIYEPNNEADENAGSHAENTVDAPVSNVISDTTGIITTGAASADSDYISEALFSVSKAGTEVTMYIWLEGTDDDCVDQIQADQIEAQIQFTIVE